jgi:hypothetical protein
MQEIQGRQEPKYPSISVDTCLAAVAMAGAIYVDFTGDGAVNTMYHNWQSDALTHPVAADMAKLQQQEQEPNINLTAKQSLHERIQGLEATIQQMQHDNHQNFNWGTVGIEAALLLGAGALLFNHFVPKHQK